MERNKMNISIEYCAVWNYLLKASSLEAELKEKFSDSTVTLIPSGGGVFEISVDGELIFSKKSLNRFPEKSEISGILKSRS